MNNKIKNIVKILAPLALMATPLLSWALIPVIAPAGTGLDLDKIQAVIERIANYLIVIGVIVAVIYIIFGAIRWITAGGDPKGHEAGRKTVLNGIIGLAIILAIGVILNTTAALVTRTFFGAGQ